MYFMQVKEANEELTSDSLCAAFPEFASLLFTPRNTALRKFFHDALVRIHGSSLTSLSDSMGSGLVVGESVRDATSGRLRRNDGSRSVYTPGSAKARLGNALQLFERHRTKYCPLAQVNLIGTHCFMLMHMFLQPVR